jgi:hypothetical protein
LLPLYDVTVLKRASVAVIEVILNAVPAVCAVTVPELPTPEVNVWPGSVTTSFETAPAVMLNAVLTTVPAKVDTVLPVAVSVYPVPALSIESPLKVACPVVVFTATVAVPLRTPPGPALVWIASVTFCAVPVTVFPPAS